MNNRIEKQIELRAPVSRVWKALTDYREFCEWFHANLDTPFKLGQVSRGHVTYPGYEHIRLEITVKEMKPETFFSYTWHPYPSDPKIDYSLETPTLVEFSLQKTTLGTLLKVAESGFDKLPADRRVEAFRMHEDGWVGQTKNIEEYLAHEQKQSQGSKAAVE